MYEDVVYRMPSRKTVRKLCSSVFVEALFAGLTRVLSLWHLLPNFKCGDRKNPSQQQLQKNGQWLRFFWLGCLRHLNFGQFCPFFKWFEFLDANIGQMSMKTIQVLSGHVASSTQTVHLRHHEVSLISMSTLSGFYVPGSVGQQHIRETKKQRRWKGRCGKPGEKQGVGLHPGKIQHWKMGTLEKEVWKKVCFLSTISIRFAFGIWIWSIIFLSEAIDGNEIWLISLAGFNCSEPFQTLFQLWW